MKEPVTAATALKMSSQTGPGSRDNFLKVAARRCSLTILRDAPQ